MCMREVDSRPKGADILWSLKTAKNSRAKHNSFLRHCAVFYQVNNWL